MIKLTEEGNRVLADIAGRYNVSQGAVEHLLGAVLSGQGNQAQFNHSELGGMGQWSAGGMTMIGDMFNGNLKAKVADICSELSHLSRSSNLQQPQPTSYQSQYQGDMTSLFIPAPMQAGNWWPDALGYAASTGAQNDLRYAVFPASRRLALSVNGHVTVYDTGDHQISGFSQQQSGDQSITFTSQHGLVRVADLQEVDRPERAAGAPAHPPQVRAPDTTQTPVAGAAADRPPAQSEDDIFTKIERLAGLHAKGILQDEEFHAKKRELLDRL